MSRVIAFWSPGSSGATTLLLNVAAALAARRISLVAADLNVLRPSLALNADLLPHEAPQSACLSALLPAMDGDRLTVDEVMRRLLPGEGFPMLPGVLDVVAANRLTEAHVQQIIQVLRGRFDLVLVDCTPALDSVACFPILEMADRICLVTGPGITSRFHTRRFVLPLRGMGWEQRTTLIYNRAGSLPPEQIAHDIGLPVAASLPELRTMDGLVEAGRIAYLSASVLPALGRFRTAVDRLASLVAQGV